ncbi:MAG: sigma-70 family RNA polymerase sigma factor [Planctomycetota bacterium]
MTDDGVLLEAVRAGDAEALRSLLEQHGPGVWQNIDKDIATQWRSVLDADDVMQVTYMEAFLQMESLSATETSGFVAWLRRIAQNNLRDAVKELGRKKRPHPAHRVHAAADQDSYVTLVEVLAQASETPSRAVAKDEAATALNSILSRLPPDYAEVVRRYDLLGEEIGSVAEAMGRSSGAIHMLRKRAHDRLRGLLGAETDFFSKTA